MNSEKLPEVGARPFLNPNSVPKGRLHVFSRFVIVCLTLGSLRSSTALAQDLTVFSPTPGSNYEFGSSLSIVPDMNNDQFGDVLVGERLGTNGVGRAHLVSAFTGQLIRTFSSPSPQTNGFFGYSVTSVPDLNLDGIADVVIGAPQETATGGPVNAGRVHVFSGSNGAFIRTINSPTPAANGRFGHAVLGVADVTGDGRGDIVVGAPGNETPAPTIAGVVYVFNGASGALITTINSPNPIQNGGFGTSIATVLDDSSPTSRDLVVGAPRERAMSITASGRAYVFDGMSTTLRFELVWSSPTLDANFGQCVVGLPSMSGDPNVAGRIAVGATAAQAVSSPLGSVHLFEASDGQFIHTYFSPNAQPNRQFGFSIAGSRDVNGDGVLDLAIGAPNEVTGSNLSGRVYRYSGADHSLLGQILPADQLGPERFGYCMAETTDALSGIGFLAIGEQRRDKVTTTSTLPSAGCVHLIRGSVDCNSNGLLDATEIDSGTAIDCDDNGVIDTCDQNEFLADCNNNTIWDRCDITNGTSLDANSDGIPDECPSGCINSLDCQNNGIPDDLELTNNDCNANGVPDDCETSAEFMIRVSQNADGVAATLDSGSPFLAAYDGAMSADGRYVAFYSPATNLTPTLPDTLGRVDVFVKDMETGEFTNIHRMPDGTLPTLDAFAGLDMSADGRFVVFLSRAGLTGPTLFIQGYLFDRNMQTTEAVSRSASGTLGNGNCLSAVITPDGRYVAFVSDATNLVSSDTNNFVDVYRLDRTNNQVIRVSVGGINIQGNGHSGVYLAGGQYFVSSRLIAISDDGRFIAFGSDASNLVANDTNACRDVFVRDCELNTTARVSVGAGSAQSNGASNGFTQNYLYPSSLDMTPDGRFVTFESYATNLVPGDTNNRVDIFVHDRILGTTRMLLVDVLHDSGTLLFGPAISDDGCFVVFTSDTINLVSGQPNVTDFDIVRYDMRTDSVEYVSRNIVGDIGNQDDHVVGPACISSDGQRILFSGQSTNLTGDSPASQAGQVFLRSMIANNCNENAVPDDCESSYADCNANLVADICECGCPGDANGDGLLDGRDVSAFVQCTLTGCAPFGCACADIDGDGVTTVDDVGSFAALLVESDSGQCGD